MRDNLSDNKISIFDIKNRQNKQRNIRAKNEMQWKECLYCEGDEIKH